MGTRIDGYKLTMTIYEEFEGHRLVTFESTTVVAGSELDTLLRALWQECYKIELAKASGLIADTTQLG